jgi:presenilin 1
LHIDVISFFFVLTNFSVVGAVTMFSMPAPLFVKQCYLVAISCSVAFIFTFVPEWSTWVLLMALVLYDIGAVLSPVGPLKMLVELAAERDEDIPALIYESRARNAPRSDDPSVASNTSLGNRDVFESGICVSEPQTEIETVLHGPSEVRGIETLPLESNNQPDDRKTEYILDVPEGIKLGLGDFIFYSVLVGRSAMFDMLTMMACFLAILTGLVCTLLWLAVSQKALPALPISISLAVVFYFASRFLLEPVIVPMTLKMLVL